MGDSTWSSTKVHSPRTAIGTSEVLEAVYVAARSPNYAIQAGAVLALGNARTDRAIEVLCEVLQSGKARMFAARALGESGNPRAMGPLVFGMGNREGGFNRKHQRPVAVLGRFGLRSLENIEAAFFGRLDRVLKEHYCRSGDSDL